MKKTLKTLKTSTDQEVLIKVIDVKREGNAKNQGSWGYPDLAAHNVGNIGKSPIALRTNANPPTIAKLRATKPGNISFSNKTPSSKLSTPSANTSGKSTTSSAGKASSGGGRSSRK